jgi:hypothetical protein
MKHLVFVVLTSIFIFSGVAVAADSSLIVSDHGPQGFDDTGVPDITAVFTSKEGINIDITSIKMLVDDEEVDYTVEGKGSVVKVIYTPYSMLEQQADHEIVVTAKDVKGNTVKKSWVFWVSMIY